MYNLREIIEKSNIIENFSGKISFDEKIAGKTSFKIGGNAPIFAEPADTKSLIKILSVLKNNNIPYFIMGGGTNIVVSDEGFEGAVISTSGLNKIELTGNADDDTVLVKAGAGCAVSRLVSFCTENCISGIEPFAGLPGTCGGAAFMNARCFNLSLSDVLHGAAYIEVSEPNVISDSARNSDGTGGIEDIEGIKEHFYSFNPADWDYKVSPFSVADSAMDSESRSPVKKVITEVIFRLTRKTEQERQEIENKSADFIRQRVEKGHFKYPCAGSVFKNNRDFGEPTGKIIDSLGLKGYSIGDAQVAPWHGNIIINKGKATSKEVFELTEFLRKKVYEKKGILLESEIIFCGKNY